MFCSQSKTAIAHRRLVINRRLFLPRLRVHKHDGRTRERPAGGGVKRGDARHRRQGTCARKICRRAIRRHPATVGKSDTARYVRGIQLYADAKAEFDAMIAELKFDLTTGQDPARSAVFTGALQGAADKRVAFTSFVSREVVDKVKGARPGLPKVVTAVPELVKAITDAGLAIGKAFHDAGKERRDAILAEVDRLRWRSFADLAK